LDQTLFFDFKLLRAVSLRKSVLNPTQNRLLLCLKIIFVSNFLSSADRVLVFDRPAFITNFLQSQFLFAEVKYKLFYDPSFAGSNFSVF
jgi:hypothetical protein